MSKWMLPEYVSDVLPSEARKIEEMRRCILDQFRLFGYELVMPPILEYLDSLLTGTGKDLDVKTFKLLDVHSGKTMGIRADITPQIARIDAHLLNRKGITRLCYVGETLHTKSNNNQETRTPLQIGAEIYGTTKIQADIEIARLMQKSLEAAGIEDFYISISHAGFLDHLKINTESNLFNAILAKDIDTINKIQHEFKQIIIELINIHSIEQISLISLKYPILNSICKDIIDIYNAIGAKNVIIDITDIEGYHYHTGLTYNIYHAKTHSPIAKGGRYDKVSCEFGRLRPATGFSINLRQISPLSNLKIKPHAILAPWIIDNELEQLINELRSCGKVVIQLEQDINIDEFTFNQQIILAQNNNTNNKWQIINI